MFNKVGLTVKSMYMYEEALIFKYRPFKFLFTHPLLNVFRKRSISHFTPTRNFIVYKGLSSVTKPDHVIKFSFTTKL